MDTQQHQQTLPQNILAFLWLLKKIVSNAEVHPKFWFTFHDMISHDFLDTFLFIGGGPLELQDFWHVITFVNYFTPRMKLILSSHVDNINFIRGLTSEVIREAGFPSFTKPVYPETKDTFISGHAIYSDKIPNGIHLSFRDKPERWGEAFARVNQRNQTLPPIDEFEKFYSPEVFTQKCRYRGLTWNSIFLSYLLVSSSLPNLENLKKYKDENSLLEQVRQYENSSSECKIKHDSWLTKYENFWIRLSELQSRHFRIGVDVHNENIVRRDLEVTLPDGRVLHPGMYVVREYSPWRIVYAALALELSLPILNSLTVFGAFDI